MIFDDIGHSREPAREAIRAAFEHDEPTASAAILAGDEISPETRSHIAVRAAELVRVVRSDSRPQMGVEAFLQEYSLASEEGASLMCLAEALLRVPDAATATLLLRDKLGAGGWEKHLGHSPSRLVNAATQALVLASRVVREEKSLPLRLLAGAGEPVIRHAVVAAMRMLGGQFVMGRTIGRALARAAKNQKYRHSFDMLGEAARTRAAAEEYAARYAQAIAAVAASAGNRIEISARPGISVKLSALHPRYEEAQRARVWAELLPRLRQLALEAKRVGIGFTIDAEESERLELSLDLAEALSGDPELRSWDGLGLAVQAYQTRALPVVDHLIAMARRHRRRLAVRLVKGAYWDAEIKRAQEKGLDNYPVFTRKAATDVSYIACARRLLAAGSAIYAGFATHNAHTAAAILELAGERRDWEFQRLHGMGEVLHDTLLGAGAACRIYAPVGSYQDLLAYLVRRLLENGANTSFVHRLTDPAVPVDDIIADPITRLEAVGGTRHPKIPLPRDLYGGTRLNSRGIDLAHEPDQHDLANALEKAGTRKIDAYPLTGDPRPARPGLPVHNPADISKILGSVVVAAPVDIDIALERAVGAQSAWNGRGVAARAAILRRAADLLEARRAEFASLIIREGGRTLANALEEVREAVDFCRYYAVEAERQFAAPALLDGPVGEANRYGLTGRGVFACISPWNFPLAIFLGQIAAALVAGNTVIAKPAEQTPLTGFASVRLLHEAGIPEHVLHFLPGDGYVGALLVADPRIAGVAFTGSLAVAQAINRSLAARDGPIVPLIAETGGINVMIVDASALPEQVTADVLRSAFDSAGQRCSALRVLYLQADIAERMLAMITGAMAELRIGDPARLSTDIGPVIDLEARDRLTSYLAEMTAAGRLIAAGPPLPAHVPGYFVSPALLDVSGIAALSGEVFGPILHVARWRAGELDQVLDAVSAAGYGLTLGIHSRIDTTVRRIVERAPVGNIYVNRNMIGAVVGVQPFGGAGLSGTGPKAGGPRYLARFAVERSISVNTAAMGGNLGLLSLDDGAGDGDDA